MIRIGLVSDTHGLLRPEALAFLRGSDRIVHAGDIGQAAILDELARIAPVTAVRGNNDRGAWAARLPATGMIRIGDAFLYAIHDLAQLDIDTRAAACRSSCRVIRTCPRSSSATACSSSTRAAPGRGGSGSRFRSAS